jgi:hemerythrin
VKINEITVQRVYRNQVKSGEELAPELKEWLSQHWENRKDG